MATMQNLVEELRSPAIGELLPGIRKFEIGELLFASLTCPGSGEWEASWAEHDCMMHVVTGRKSLRTATGIWELGPGDTLFVRKGAFFLREDAGDVACLLIFFIPDGFARTAIREMAFDLPALTAPAEPRDIAIRVQHDAGVV